MGCIHAMPTLRKPGVPDLLDCPGDSASQVCSEKTNEALPTMSAPNPTRQRLNLPSNHPEHMDTGQPLF